MPFSYNQKKYLDIIEILSLKENQILLGPGLKSKFFRKKLIFQSFLQGEASFYEVLGNLYETFLIILSSLKILKNSGKQKSDLIGKLILTRFFGNYPLDPVYFFHHKLHYLPPNEMTIRDQYLHFCSLAEMVREIALVDQYCAHDFLKKDAVIVDVGANIGVFSLFANFLAPNGKIFSFEPFTKAFQILQRNIIDNNLSGVVSVFQQALGEDKKKSRLLISHESLGTGSIIEDSEFLKNREELFFFSEPVSIITLDEFIFQNKIKRVDFIKIDAEGYEKQIIKGARNTIKKFSPVIACSAYHLKNDKKEIPQLIKFINPNYQVKVEKKPRKF
jgi:FkbM family methyltransferase